MLVTCVCLNCGKEFECKRYPPTSKRVWGKYCSHACMHALCHKSNITHGHSLRENRTLIYGAWASMIQRCNNSKDTLFRNYGARGITVCERWLTFANFLEDMGERPAGKTLDRKDNEKGYYKGNCKWSTRSEQQRNRRANRLITYNGETRCLTAWAEKIKIHPNTLYGRLESGWSIEKALTTPLLQNSKQSAV